MAGDFEEAFHTKREEGKEEMMELTGELMYGGIALTHELKCLLPGMVMFLPLSSIPCPKACPRSTNPFSLKQTIPTNFVLTSLRSCRLRN